MKLALLAASLLMAGASCTACASRAAVSDHRIAGASVPVPDTLRPDTPCTDPPCAGSAETSAAIGEYPPAQPAGPESSWVSEATAITMAQSMAVSDRGLTLATDERASLPAAAQRMTADQAAVLLNKGRSLDPLLPAERQVWIVAVHGYRHIDVPHGLNLPGLVLGYTVVFDAPTGYPILVGTGLEALPTG